IIHASFGSYSDEKSLSWSPRLAEVRVVCVDVAVVGQVGVAKPFCIMGLTQLGALQLSVVVLVVSRENLGKFRDFDAFWPISISFPTVHKNAITVDYRHGLELPRHAAHPPLFLARIEGVRGHFEGAGDDQL